MQVFVNFGSGFRFNHGAYFQPVASRDLKMPVNGR
jgi:hypothetical protein